jgi:peptidyl-prolyl isomerase D
MRLLGLFATLGLGLGPGTTREPEKHKTPYFDVEYLYEGKEKRERLVFDLYWDVAPKTAENFARFVEGVELGGKPRCYAGTIFHRIVRGFVVQGGDVVSHDGTGSISIYGDTFEDENFKAGHGQAGRLSMANRGPDTNGSQFFITLGDKSFLDGRHVVFGEVRSGCMEAVMEISKVPVGPLDKPISDVRIVESGFLEDEASRKASKEPKGPAESHERPASTEAYKEL